MSYDYLEAKKEILDILDSKIEIEETDTILSDDSFTFDNGIRTWVGAVFVDIVKSSSFFTNSQLSKNMIARIIRSLVEQIVTIMNDNENHYEIGIRGDCVYGIFQANTKDKIVDMFRTSYCINTFLKMFNGILSKKGLPKIYAGIGIGASQDVVIKAGKKRITHDKIWVGDAVINASNLSKIANRGYYDPICMDYLTYYNIIDSLREENPNYDKWIRKTNSPKFKEYFYQCNIIQIDFNNWIDKEFGGRS